jgi:hypothetical protein
MRKSRFNAIFRDFAKNHLSPTPGERDFVSGIYEALQNVIGESNSLQIGSYPRFTSITPLHDLDVLYIAGKWNPASPANPSAELSGLHTRLERDYVNPTKYQLKISPQTHSITLSFLENGAEVFAVDVVPAYISGTNRFGNDTYVVPEIFSKSHAGKMRKYEELRKSARQMAWIPSDPRGYIEVAKRVNDQNSDFRKSVKLIKAWKSSCKRLDGDFKLKSFHLEQVVTGYFQNDPTLEIYDAVFKFFCDIPDIIQQSQIPDRADATRNIDAYVDSLTGGEKEKIIQARDFFLIKLENFTEDDLPEDLINAGFHKRASNTEAYLFDQKIPILSEQEFGIIGRVLPRAGGFRGKILDALGLIEIDHKIEFRLDTDAPEVDMFKWKVKNDDNSPEPRGEITDYGTLRDPEGTKYNGSHFVECYGIHNGVCTARSRQNVVLQHRFGGGK